MLDSEQRWMRHFARLALVGTVVAGSAGVTSAEAAAIPCPSFTLSSGVRITGVTATNLTCSYTATIARLWAYDPVSRGRFTFNHARRVGFACRRETAGAGIAGTYRCLRGSQAASWTSSAPPRRLVGCQATGPSFRLAGWRGRRAVALTFDDGPGPQTARVLDVLHRYRAPSTFFVLGSQVRGHEHLLQRELREGHAIGNHTFGHVNVAGGGYSQMAGTQGAIRRATGYMPCVFRFPYGSVGGAGVAQARALGMLSIQWDVDPRDWATPGSGAVYSRVVSAVRPGSIVVLHDAGGYRGQTVAALPGIIATLRRRGYQFVTVPQLLRLTPRYGP